MGVCSFSCWAFTRFYIFTFTLNHSKLEDGHNKLHLIRVSFFGTFGVNLSHISEPQPFLLIYVVGYYPVFTPGGCSKREKKNEVSGKVEHNDGVKAGHCLDVCVIGCLNGRE